MDQTNKGIFCKLIPRIFKIARLKIAKQDIDYFLGSHIWRNNSYQTIKMGIQKKNHNKSEVTIT